MDGAGLRVLPAQGVARPGGRQQLAFGRFGAEMLGRHRHRAAQGNAMLVLKRPVREPERRGLASDLQLEPVSDVVMPANNRTLIFRRAS